MLTLHKLQSPASLNMCVVINKDMTTLILSKFSRHDFRNFSTFDIRILGYIDIIQRNERSPKVWFITPGTFSICVIKFRVKCALNCKMFQISSIHSLNRFYILQSCLTTGPLHFPKPFLDRVRSSAPL